MTAPEGRPDADAARRLLEAAQASPPGVGESIGCYELLEEIGRGGHSAVFRARQRAPVGRELAVKILVDPSPSVNVAARFARERSVVARLRHPGIVPLLDAGEVGPPGAAVPWFAMPLIDGEPVDRWCDRIGAPRSLRLDVVERAARAVAAAHALGIVHRDLKPGNILVSGTRDEPQVHIIDFGVAKILDASLEDAAPLATRVGGIVGTPEFMSPEQANLDAAAIGPETDVYALGLVLCVLLSGSIPGVAPGARVAQPMGERLRRAADRMVAPVSELAGDRALRGEIDWIVAKACARDFQERYRSAGALADDLARLREGQPIVAAPKDSGYAVTFALRRYRSQLLVAAAALVLVVATLAAAVVRERSRADEESSRRERLTKLLERARLELIPLTGRGRGDVVDEQKALPLAEMMYAINLEVLGSDANETQRSALVLARALDRARRYPESEVIYRGLLAAAERKGTRLGDVAFLKTQLAGCLRRGNQGQLGEARRMLDEAVAFWRALEDPPFVLCTALLETSFLAGLEGRPEEQSRFLDEAIACCEADPSAQNLRTREAYGFKADFHRERGDIADARAWYGRALDGLDPAAEPTARVWWEAWRGELLWIDRQEARRTGATIDTAREAEFQALVAALRARDSANPRLERWAREAP